MFRHTTAQGQRWLQATLALVLLAVLIPQPPTSSAATTAPPVAAPSSGCGSSQTAPVVEEQRFIDVGGSERWFLLTVPGAHDGSKPLPLVIDFHGLSEGANIHTLMSEFSPIAEREGFVVVFPQGRFDPVRWDADPNSNPNEDIDFVDAMLDTLGEDLCLDERRVYAAGLSYGAFMTSLITCARSDRFAAVAPVAGIRLPDPCAQSRDVPIITFHGTADPIVLFNGGFGSLPFAAPLAADLNGPGIPANVAGWAARNGCGATPTDTQTTDEVVHRVYDCPTGADVEFYIVLGGGHTWPGSEFSRAIEAVVGYTTFDIHASEEAWSFFERFQLPCPTDVVCDEGEDPTDPPPSSSTTQPPTADVQATQASVAVQPAFTG